MYLAASVLAVLTSAEVVAYAVSMVHVLFGGVSTVIRLAFATVCVGIAFGFAAWRAKTIIAVVPLVAFPAVTFGWCRQAFQMPGWMYAAQEFNAYGKALGSMHSELGPAGALIVMASMAAVLLACWVCGDGRIRWFVRTLVVLAVVGVHVPVILWVMERPTHW